MPLPQHLRTRAVPDNQWQQNLSEANAYPLALLVSRDTPLIKAGSWLKALCPFHNEKTPSFTIYADNHAFCFGCGWPHHRPGTPVTYLMDRRRIDIATAVKELLGGSPTAARTATARGGGSGGGASKLSAPLGPPPSYVTKTWNDATAGPIAELYLYSRGIRVRPKPLPEALRGHEGLIWSEAIDGPPARLEPPWRAWRANDGQWYRGIIKPAMIAAITDDTGQMTAIQRTWVEEKWILDGGIPPPKGTRIPEFSKKTFGRMGTGAVRLADPGPVLGLSEGVESALSAAEMWSLPVWATCGAQRLGSIQLPECVDEVILFADNGAAGEAAAAKAEAGYRRRGYRVEVCLPESGGDWNEYLMMQVF